jgi:hypothetical protein
MPGFGPGPGLGYGVSTLVWVIAIIVVGVFIWRGRKNYVSGTSIVLQRFRIDEDPSAKAAVEISGRASGLVSWVLTLLKLEPQIELFVTDSEVTIRTASLSGIEHTYIPLGQIHATVCGYQRSVLAFGFAILFGLGFVMNLFSGFLGGNRNEVGSDMGLAFGFLILAAVALLIYFLSKRIAISVETERMHGVAFKRSVIENISVDLPEALRAISVVNAHVLAAQTVQPCQAAERTSPSQSRAVVAPFAASSLTRCPKCAAVNPAGTRFCENCGSALPA